MGRNVLLGTLAAGATILTGGAAAPALALGTGAAALGPSLLSGPKMPAIKPPTPMPDPQATQFKAKQRLAAAQTTGRQATILTSGGGEQTLGG